MGHNGGVARGGRLAYPFFYLGYTEAHLEEATC